MSNSLAIVTQPHADLPIELPETHEAGTFVVGISTIEADLAQIDFSPASLTKGDHEIGIVPLGEEGRFVWSTLPSELAILAMDPLQSAFFILHDRDLAGQSLWPAIWQQRQRVQCLSLQMTPTQSVVEYAELSPRTSSLTDWLSQACRDYQPDEVTSSADATAVRAGLFQLHNQLEVSHQYSQSCEGQGRHATPDYWHGIMHRREPDYGNSKYWFRRVGEHPIFPEVASHAVQVLQNCASPAADKWLSVLTSAGWDPFAFVDLCHDCARTSDTALIEAAQQIQWREMILLLGHSYRDAI